MPKARSVTVRIRNSQWERTFNGEDLETQSDGQWLHIRDSYRMRLATFAVSDVQGVDYTYYPPEGMNWEEVAKTAYEAHRAKVMALPGIPEWKDLRSDAKETWKALAQTMREAYNQVLTSS